MGDADPGQLVEPDGDMRPWERRGAVRRDCAPHRGNLLLLLGRVALVCGLLSVCLAVPAVIGLPLGLGVWVVGQRDLTRMAAGAMDPRGRTDVVRATDLGIGGAFLSLFFGAVIIAALLTTLLGRH